MAYLEYESVYWVPWLDKLGGYQGPASAKGYPILFLLVEIVLPEDLWAVWAATAVARQNWGATRIFVGK